MQHIETLGGTDCCVNGLALRTKRPKQVQFRYTWCEAYLYSSIQTGIYYIEIPVFIVFVVRKVKLLSFHIIVYPKSRMQVLRTLLVLVAVICYIMASDKFSASCVANECTKHIP